MINKKRVCGYLKNIYINEGKKGVDKYINYIDNESSKKKISLDRALELEDIKNTCKWWLTNVKDKIDIQKENTLRQEKRNNKEKKIIDYLIDQVLNHGMSYAQIKNPIYQEAVIEATVPF